MSPGRLRVRTQAFRCQPSRVESASRQLADMDGIDIAVNPRAGSITVRYDPSKRTQGELLGMLQELGCIGTHRVAASDNGQIAGLFGKALLGALARTVAQGSVRTLVGVLR
jgi:hypothetical protein